MAHISTKEQVYEYLESITAEVDFEHLTAYTTLDICSLVNMSRSLVSLYLNEMVEGRKTVIKISTRPVYYLNKYVFERIHAKWSKGNIWGFRNCQEIKASVCEVNDFEKAIGNTR